MINFTQSVTQTLTTETESLVICKFCGRKGHGDDVCPGLFCKFCHNYGHKFNECLNSATRETLLAKIRKDIFEPNAKLQTKDLRFLCNIIRRCTVLIGIHWNDIQMIEAIQDFVLPRLPEEMRNRFIQSGHTPHQGLGKLRALIGKELNGGRKNK